MSHHAIESYSDPWTRQKAAQAQAALARRGALGQATTPSAEPPPLKKPPVGLMVGWAALLLVSAGMFYKVTSGAPVTANRRRRSSRRNPPRKKRRSSKRKRRRSSKRKLTGRTYASGFRLAKKLLAQGKQRTTVHRELREHFGITEYPETDYQLDQWDVLAAIIDEAKRERAAEKKQRRRCTKRK